MNNMKRAICAAASVMALSMAVSSTTMAAGSSMVGGQKVAVANVSDTLLIRKDASAKGEVVGYLPSAAGVIVESMGPEWTKVTSGKVTGYVKTGYLAFDEKAEELKSVYGNLGAVAAWNDVKIFSDYENTSSVIGTLNEGEGYEILGSTENWIEIQLANGDTAYVATEDVQMAPVLATAVSTDDYVEPAAVAETPAYAEAADAVYEEPVYEEPVYEEPVYEEPVYTEVIDEAGYVDETQQYYDETVYTEEVDTQEVYVDPGYAYDMTYAADTTDVDSEYYTEEAIAAETQNTTTATASQKDLDLLAALIYCEAGNQPEEGKIAVGQVVMNRVASDVYANSIHDVIYEGGQFSPAGSGWLDSVIGSAPSDCYDAAAAALAGEGTVGDALYFNTGSGKGVKIGAHQFY